MAYDGFCKKCGAVPKFGGRAPYRKEKGIGYIYEFPCKNEPNCDGIVEMDLSGMQEAAMGIAASETGPLLKSFGEVHKAMKDLMDNVEVEPNVRVAAGRQVKSVAKMLMEFSGVMPERGLRAAQASQHQVIEIRPGGALAAEMDRMVSERRRSDLSAQVIDVEVQEAASKVPDVAVDDEAPGI